MSLRVGFLLMPRLPAEEVEEVEAAEVGAGRWSVLLLEWEERAVCFEAPRGLPMWPLLLSSRLSRTRVAGPTSIRCAPSAMIQAVNSTLTMSGNYGLDMRRYQIRVCYRKKLTIGAP